MASDVADQTGSLRQPGALPGAGGGCFPVRLFRWLSAGHFPLVVVYRTPKAGKGLARELGRRLAQKGGGSAPILWTGKQLARAYRDAAQTKRLEDLRRSFLGAGLLAIDSLEAIGRNPPVQEFFAGILDGLEQTGAVTILSIGLNLTEWDCFAPRLRARLQAGLCIPYGYLPVAAPGQSSAPELWEPAREGLAEVVPAGMGAGGGRGRHGSRGWALRAMAFIAKSVARLWGVSLAELRGSARHRAVATARHVAMFLARERLSLSLKQIGRYFGGRDHTTVAHACRRIAAQLASDPVLQSSVAAVEASFAQHSGGSLGSTAPSPRAECEK
ncbi:MAG: hypothetical protein NZ899_04480 [Thermoguttaceae bacterium]|nr:hypothetical protein [Thermoguttaceae bacterium]MDW8077842.1 helix-turn-helix domain-containing protein [Thermoguttaceae bacterium]